MSLARYESPIIWRIRGYYIVRSMIKPILVFVIVMLIGEAKATTQEAHPMSVCIWQHGAVRS